MKEVVKENKSLWHIQNLNISSDGFPFDIFVWSDHEPTKNDLEYLVKEWFSGSDGFVRVKKELLTSSEIYRVYADDMELNNGNKK